MSKGSKHMAEAIITAAGSILVAVITVIAVVLSNNKNAAAMDAKLDKQQEVQNTKLEALTTQVGEIRGIVADVPVIKANVENMEARVCTLERKVIG